MKILVISTIRGKNENIQAVQTINDVLKSSHHTVFSDHVLKTSQDDLGKMSETENVTFHRNILKKIKEAEVIVAECSYQSMSVGYLIANAASLGKIVLIFYKEQAMPPNLFLTLSESDGIFVVPYTQLSDLKKLVMEYINFVSADKNIRFNLFLTSEINAYLNWVSKKFSLSKSVFIRRLILDKMSNDHLYSS